MSKSKQDAAVERCPWAGIGDPVYARYHDEEWGVPHADDVRLFEKLVLEGFQSGLSWLTILKKRDNFRNAFDGFDAERIARYGARERARLMADAGIVRNRLKIDATIDNAKAYLKLRERTTLAAFLWSFLDDGPIQNKARKHVRLGARDRRVEAHLEGAQGRGLPLRRADDGLRLHAVGGHGQRSSRLLPPACAVRQAAARVQAAEGLRRS